MRTADDLVKAMTLDIWPRVSAIVDFGIDSQGHYEAFHRAVREAGVTADELHAVVGNGPKITALLNARGCNPLGLKFLTSYDDLEDDLDDDEPTKPNGIFSKS